MSDEQVMITTFTKAFNKYVYDEMVIGQLAHTELKDGVRVGAEVDVIMPAMVTLFDYTGGDLNDAELTTTTTAKVKFDKGKAFHYEVDEVKKQQINNAPDLKQKVELAKEYSSDAIKQFAAAVDTAYGKLYTRAGHYLSGTNNTAISLTSSIAKEIFAYMQAKFQRGDGKGHTNWIDGQMVAIVPPEYQFYLGQLEDLKYVESGHQKMAKGYIGKLSGWNIVVSNNVASVTEQNGSISYYPLFGIKGKTLAGGISKNLNMKDYMPEKNFNTRYKGYGLYGVGAPRADFLGTVKINAPLVLSANAA
ncbi:hypothetical protein IJ674_10400 [bacterium]|nr:hypothetical protein [bacterium]